MYDPAKATVPAVRARLILTRKAIGLNQKEFAERAGLAKSAYNNYERGKNWPQIAASLALCQCYHLTMDWIYLGDPARLPSDLSEKIHALIGGEAPPRIKRPFAKRA